MKSQNTTKRFIASILPIISFAIDKGITPGTILSGTGLTEKHLLDPDKLVSQEQELKMIRNLFAQYPHPELAWKLGRYYHAKAQGVIGRLTVNAPTLKDAYEILLEYSMLSHSFFRIYTETTPETIRVYLIESNLPPEILPFFIERDFVAMLTGLEEFFPGRKSEIIHSVSFSHAPRTEVKKYQKVLFEKITFNQPATYIEIRKNALSLNIPGSDKKAFELYRQQCQAEYYLRGGKRIYLSDKVRICLQAENGKIKLAEIADKLHMNEKSLRRQLHKEGINFRKIKQDYILHRTIVLLQDPSISVGEIAEKMGYSETCAFTRQFQRQTGISPSKYRKIHLTAPE